MAPATVRKASAKPLFGYWTVGVVRRRLRHPVERFDRSAARAVHECKMRPAGRGVRRHDLRRVALFQGH
jgi:hypothetical protein